MSQAVQRTLRILYVDPDADLCVRITSEFEDRGFEVDSVADVEGAQAVLSDGFPSCIVSEYDLPTQTGFELFELVRESHQVVPFVIFTGSGSEQVASDALTRGVTEYLPKEPLSEQIPCLVERVEQLLEPFPEGDVSEQLKDRAMDRAPVGITVADMRPPDEPLIYANKAFERLTGYSVEETVGRNCRFLQGEDFDEVAVASMRAAIENDDSTAVELRNYRKDGTEFWNRVEIAPIHDTNGDVTHYVGYQTDVSARKEAEIAARERADALERKQQKLESILLRIEGLLREVSVSAINVRTVDELERQVCEALVNADGYRLAWMGERQHESNAVDPGVIVGGDESDIETPEPLVEVALRDAVVAFDGTRARREDATGQVADAETARESAPVENVGTWLGDDVHNRRAVVPVTYRETTYGVLGIYTHDDHEFDEHEAIVFSTLGRIVGTALNAVRTQSFLQGEAATEIELSIGDDEGFVALTSGIDCRLDHVGTIPPGEDPEMKLFFEVKDSPPTEVVEAAWSREDITDATVVSDAGTRNTGLVRIAISDSPLIDALAEYSGTITDANAVNGTGTVTIQLSKDANPRSFFERFESRVPSATIESYRDDERPRRTNQEFVAEVTESLTDRQRDTLRTAYASGFFDSPRQVSGDDLAEVMDITRATFHQHLRAAERKMLDAFFRQ
jgi:PAS domain S-box-containing protein